MKKVLLATRPLTPPWDEASKNFAYFLGKSIQDHDMTLLSTKEPLLDLPKNTVAHPLFTDEKLTLWQKMRLIWFLRQKRNVFDVTHYLFTPTKQNAALIQKFALPKRGKTLQTIATLREDLYTPEELRHTLFADHLVVYTDLTKKKLQALGFSQVSRIYPGIDLDLYSLRPKNDAFLQSLNLTNDHFVAIYPGEYTRLGATDMLTDLCIRYFSEKKDSPLRFIFACRVKNEADARKKEELQRKFEEAGVLEYVRFTDTVPDMPSLYNISDTVLFPVQNLNGKFDVPLVIIEAYACQKPVILTDLEAFTEFSDPTFCVTIPKGQMDILSEKIDFLMQNPTERNRLGQEARIFVEKHFNLENTAKEYSQLYSSL